MSEDFERKLEIAESPVKSGEEPRVSISRALLQEVLDILWDEKYLELFDRLHFEMRAAEGKPVKRCGTCQWFLPDGPRHSHGKCAKSLEYGLTEPLIVQKSGGNECREWDQIGTTESADKTGEKPQVLQSEPDRVVGSAGLEPATSTVSR